MKVELDGKLIETILTAKSEMHAEQPHASKVEYDDLADRVEAIITPSQGQAWIMAQHESYNICHEADISFFDFMYRKLAGHKVSVIKATKED